MHPVITRLLEALTLGGIRFDYGRIEGRCGYVNFATRTVVLNPDADPAQLEAEIGHELAKLIAAEVPTPRLELAHSVAEPELPGPRPPERRRRAFGVAE